MQVGNENIIKKLKFGDLIRGMQPCYDFYRRDPSIVKMYFKYVYADLVLRNEKAEGVSLRSLFYYFKDKIPFLVVERIFNTISSGVLAGEEFMNGMISLYFAQDLESMLTFSFGIFDLDSDGVITKEDMELIFLHFWQGELTQSKDCISFVGEFFDVKKSNRMEYREYSEITREKNSSIFLMFYFYIYKNQNFDENVFIYLKEYKGRKVAEKQETSCNIKDHEYIAEPGRLVKNMLKYYMRMPTIKVNRKLGSKNVINEQGKDEGFKPKGNNSMNSLISQNFPNNDEYKDFSADSPAISLECHQLNLNSKDGRKDSHLFSFKYSKYKNKYKLDQIMPLVGILPCKCDDTQFSDYKTFYTFTLMNSLGSCLVNLRKVFFCFSERGRDNFLSELEKDLKVRRLEDYCITEDEEIASGHFGKVRIGVNKQTKQKVAIKEIKKLDKSNINSDSDFLASEVEVMKFLSKFNHPNVVKLLDVFEDKKFVYIIMEYTEEGSLYSYLSRRRSGYTLIDLDEEFLLSFIIQISDGLKFIHSLGIIHRDIKCPNILIFKEDMKGYASLTFKICDFGLAKIGGRKVKSNETFGTLLYSAPEILTKSEYDNKVDSWSFGVVIYYILTGGYPFLSKQDCQKGADSKVVKHKICNKALTFPDFIEFNIYSDDEFYSLIIDLIRSCLYKDPVYRFSSEQILTYLGSFNI